MSSVTISQTIGRRVKLDVVPSIPTELLTPLGVLGIIGFILVTLTLFIAMGLLVPRWTVRSLLKTKDEQIKFLLDLRTTDDARYGVLESTVNDLKTVGETSLKILNALPVPHNGDKGGGS
jgi:hypothetical protein